MTENGQDRLLGVEISRTTFLDHPLTRALGRTAVAGIALMTLAWIPTKIEFSVSINTALDIAGAVPFVVGALYALRRMMPLQIFQRLRV